MWVAFIFVPGARVSFIVLLIEILLSYDFVDTVVWGCWEFSDLCCELIEHCEFSDLFDRGLDYIACRSLFLFSLTEALHFPR